MSRVWSEYNCRYVCIFWTWGSKLQGEVVSTWLSPCTRGLSVGVLGIRSLLFGVYVSFPHFFQNHICCGPRSMYYLLTWSQRLGSGYQQRVGEKREEAGEGATARTWKGSPLAPCLRPHVVWHVLCFESQLYGLYMCQEVQVPKDGGIRSQILYP